MWRVRGSRNATDVFSLSVAQGSEMPLLNTRAWLGLSIAHGNLTIIRVRADGKSSVLVVGDDVAHIPRNLQSWGAVSDLQLIAPPSLPNQPEHAPQ